MSAIKNYLFCLAERTAEVIEMDNKATEDLVSWYFGDDPTEYFLEAYFDGKDGMQKVWNDLLSFKGDMPWDDEQPNIDSVIVEIEKWLPELAKERIEEDEIELSPKADGIAKAWRQAVIG